MISIDLTGKKALVTGSNKGIGKAIAIYLAKAGADVIGVSRSMPLSGSDVQLKIEALGKNFFPYQADFSDRDSIYTFIKKAKNEHHVIDILVNNAGTIMRKPAAEHPDEYWDSVISTNLDAQFILTREIGKEMVERGNGKIIFVASLLTFQGGITVPGYAASKGAIGSLIKAFANEWAAKGVNVNGIAPGYIATDNTEALRNDPERSASILSRIPANRWGQAEDMAGPVVFLASDLSSYMNGSIITIDGGWMGR